MFPFTSRQTLLLVLATLLALVTTWMVLRGIPAVLFDHVGLYVVADALISVALGILCHGWKATSRMVSTATTGRYNETVQVLDQMLSTWGSSDARSSLVSLYLVLSVSCGASLLWAPQLFHGNTWRSVMVVGLSALHMIGWVRTMCNRGL